MDHREIADTLYKARIKKNLTIQQLSIKSGISYSTIYRAERNINHPSLEVLTILCKALDLQVEVKGV